jgi:hypothetical protein
MMKHPLQLLIALQSICCSLNVQAQTANQTPATTKAVPANALSNSPGLQRARIRHDTPAQREVFLNQRLQQMQQQKIQEVTPLPAQRIEPPHSQSQK